MVLILSYVNLVEFSFFFFSKMKKKCVKLFLYFMFGLCERNGVNSGKKKGGWEREKEKEEEGRSKMSEWVKNKGEWERVWKMKRGFWKDGMIWYFIVFYL